MRTKLGKMFGGLHLDYGTNDGHVCKKIFRHKGPDSLYVADVVNNVSERFSDLKSRFLHVDISTSRVEADDESFDSISCIHVLEHVPTPSAVIDEFVRLLKPGGFCYVETPNNRTILTPSFGFGPTCNFYDDPTHIRPFTAKGLSRLCQQAGLSLVKSGIDRNIPYALSFPVSPILSLVLRDWRPIYYSTIHVIGWSSYALCRKD